MAQFLTKRKLRSKRFVKNEMFKCVRPGSENPTDENWMNATYISSEIENGFKVEIHSSHSLFRIIKPFTEGLFQITFYHRNSIRGDYLIEFKIEIMYSTELTPAGDFCYISNRNPFEPEMEGIKTNPYLCRYLDQPFMILVTTKFYGLPPFNPYFLEPSSPKPLEKTFKFDQCVICLDRKPDVVFIKCNHICVCNECEKMHPSSKCSYCRTEISKRLLI